MPSKSSDRSKILNLGVFCGEDVPFATFVMIRPPDSVKSAVGYPENPDHHRFFKHFYGFNRFYIIDLLYLHKVGADQNPLSIWIRDIDFRIQKCKRLTFSLWEGFHAFKIVRLL